MQTDPKSSSRVLVVDQARRPLVPCSAVRARQLLHSGRAAILRHFPFVIILKRAVTTVSTPAIRLSFDPGSNTTGIGLSLKDSAGAKVIWAAELAHRGNNIVWLMAKRRACRQARRARKTRYRQARHDNRRRPVGWLAPSLRSDLERTLAWAYRLCRWVPVSNLSVELPNFDTQKLISPQIAGQEYQLGPLAGTTKREVLKQSWNGKCAYCGESVRRFHIEHVVPSSRGGSDSLRNNVLSCPTCNRKKGQKSAAEFGFPLLHKGNLRGAGVMNALRWQLWQGLRKLNLPMETSSGGVTAKNRLRQGYPKMHWIDAACVGKTGQTISLNPNMRFWAIKSFRRHARHMTISDKFGFPKTKAKVRSKKHDFLTGDFVRAVVPRGCHKGTHVGRAIVQARGYISIGKNASIWHRHCRRLQHRDGYSYTFS